MSWRRAVLIGIACLAVLDSAPALAAQPPELLRLPPAGQERSSSAAGKLDRAAGIATDPQTGHLFIADAENARIDEFTSWGVFLRAFGWGVADGEAAPQSCGPQASPPTSTCEKGIAGSGPGQLNDPEGIALDAAGDIFVYERKNHRVEKFSADGELLLAFGGFETEVVGTYLAIGPGGTVFVGDVGKIQEFDLNGVFQGQITTGLAGETVSYLAADSGGNLYVARNGKDDVIKLGPSGELLPTSFAVQLPGSIALDADGNVYIVSRLFNPEPPEVLKFDPSGKCTICAGDKFAALPRLQDFFMPTIATNVVGGGSTAAGDIYVSAFDGIVATSRSYITVFGPIPRFEPPPPLAPTIEDQFTASAGTTSAKVQALINPHFFQSTTYYVEYGTGKCSEGGCATQPAPPGSSLGGERDAGVRTAPVLLDGLTPGTTYHFRFVAISGAFTSRGTGEGEAEGTFTSAVGGGGLPDDRAYEMVSPPDKNSGDVAIPGSAGGLVNKSVKPEQAAASGEAITYASFTAFGEAPQSAPGGSQYVSRRGPDGWVTENVTPPYEGSFTRDPLRGFAPDLGGEAIVQREPPLLAGAPEGVENLYVRGGSVGPLTLVSSVAPEVAAETGYCVNFSGATPGFGRVIFSANGSLTDEAPKVKEGQDLYEWTPATGVRFVGLLPNENPAPVSPTTGFGAGGNACEVQSNIVRNAISADGSKIFWTSSADQLFARLDGVETTELDARQGGPGPAGGGQFWAASDDGSKVFFTDLRKLTPGAGTGDLYRYDFSLEEGQRLTDISAGTGGEVEGVLGAAEDGSSVYFVAAPDKLFRWHDGEGLRLIAQLRGGLDESDASDWEARPKFQTARVSPDGEHVAFLSVEPLTGFDNRDQATGKRDSEVFLYDATADELRCASCGSSGARPVGPASLPTWSTPYEQVRYLSDDGSRVFFTTFDALDLRDTNGRQDVYEFELAGSGECSPASPAFSVAAGGCIGLLSSGTSAADSYLVDASADGRDVFISTAQRVLPRDEDERYDVYDVRVGGGFPEPGEARPPCQGEACRPSASPPGEAVPGSSGFQGSGNVTPKRPVSHRHHRKRRRPHRGQRGRRRAHR